MTQDAEEPRPSEDAVHDWAHVVKWLRQCVAYCEQHDPRAPDVRAAVDAERKKLRDSYQDQSQLNEVRLVLARGIIPLTFPAKLDDDPRIIAVVIRGVTGAALWSLITHQTDGDSLSWSHPLYVLSSKELRDLARECFHQCQSRTQAATQTSNQQIDPILERLASRLSEPQHAEGIRHLLGDLCDPMHGGPQIVRAFSEQKPDAPKQRTLLAILAAAATASSVYAIDAAVAGIIGNRADALLGTVLERPAVVETSGAAFPVRMREWQHEIDQRNTTFSRPNGYWSYVPAGRYFIGGWGEDTPGHGDNRGAYIRLMSFWIARFPVTVAQYRAFIEANGYHDGRYWTPGGWRWKSRAKSYHVQRQFTDTKREQPSYWGSEKYCQDEQPVIGVSWYEAAAFCEWLTNNLNVSLSYINYALRLPTEAEWEGAAAYDSRGQRRTYPWGENEPTPAHAVYGGRDNEHDRPAPVGSCPAGAAACGALDMAGNVWEWTISRRTHNYQIEHRVQFVDYEHYNTWDLQRRGASWSNTDSEVRCGVRNGGNPQDWQNNLGFRVVFALRVPS